MILHVVYTFFLTILGPLYHTIFGTMTRAIAITIYLASCEHFITAIGAFGIMTVFLTSIHMKLHFINIAFRKIKQWVS